MSYLIIQIWEPYEGREDMTMQCFKIWGETHFTVLSSAINFRDSLPNPERYIVIQAW